jgi:hypothetical protein
MALLRVDTPGKPNIVRVELDGNTNARLRRYSRYTDNGTIQSIVKGALNFVFDADKDFVEWEKQPANQVEPERKKRNKRGASAPPEGGAAPHTPAAAATAKK